MWAAQVDLLEKMSRLLGLNIEIYESQDGIITDRRGKVHDDINGAFLRDGDVIIVDLKAGADYSGLMTNTLAHELGHRIRAWSPTKFYALADYLMEHFPEVNANAMKFIRNKMNADPSLSFDDAYEEVVCDALEAMLNGEEVMAHMEAITHQDAELGRRLLKETRQAVNRMMAVFKRDEFDYGPRTEAEVAVMKMTARLDDLHRLFAEGLADMADRTSPESERDNKNTPADAEVKNSIRTTKDGIKYVKLDGNIFLRSDGTEMTKREAYNALVGRKIVLEDGDEITFIKNLPGGRSVYDELFKKRPGYESGIDIVAVSEKINRNIVETVAASKMVKPNETQRHPHVGVVDFDLRDVYLDDGNVIYRLEMNIANLTDGSKVAYVKRYIEHALPDITEKIRMAETAGQSPLNRPSNETSKKDVSIGSISNPVEKINPFGEKNSRRGRSNRTILSEALETVASEQDRTQIKQYLSLMYQTDRLQGKVDELNAKRKELDRSTDKAEYDRINKRLDELNEQIGKNDRLIAKLGGQQAISRLLEKTKENTPADAGVKKMRRNATDSVIDLSKDNRLLQMVGNLHGSARYNIIRDYILNELADQPIRMSDGKLAIVDRGDAQHIAKRSGDKKVAQISQIKKVIENAQLVAEEVSTKDRKFDYFWYYEAMAKYKAETLPIYVNLGRARNGEGYHIYDLTNKLRDTAHRVNDVGRPVGNALENGISIDSISNLAEKINPSGEKNSRRGRSNRTILSEALETVASEQDRTQIKQYLSLMYQTDRLQGKVDELNAKRKELDRSTDKAEYDRINKRLDELNEQIGKNDRLIAKLGGQQAISRLLEKTKENTPADAEVKSMVRHVEKLGIPWVDNFSDIKAKLKQHMNEVNKMKPVTGVSFNVEDRMQYAEKLSDILRTRFGYKVERQDIGTILFDKKAIANMRKYVRDDAEAAAFLTAPYVLKRGKIICGQQNHKNKGYPSVTIAAPVEINGMVGNVAVTVLFAGRRRAHALRILAPNGTVFELSYNKNGSAYNDGNIAQGDAEPSISTTNNSISNTVKKINPSDEKNLSAT